MKKAAEFLPVGSVKKPNAPKGNSTPKAKKHRSMRRYFEVKICITVEYFVRGLLYFYRQGLLGFLFVGGEHGTTREA